MRDPRDLDEIQALLADLPWIVKEIRDRHELSLRYVAERTGVSPNTIWRFEHDADSPLSTVLAVLRWLDTDATLDPKLMRSMMWVDEPWLGG
jgi:transcriptional regulator with XRE-family HTH domain